jgi:predicted ester cyclase
MSKEQNEAVFRRFVAEGLNQNNLESFQAEICAPDLVLEAPGIKTQDGIDNGYELFKASVLGFVGAFPDVECTLPYVVSEGDVVAADIAYHGTQEGDFAGVPATHEHIHGGELWFVEFQDGKMKSVRICEYGTPLRAALIAAGAHGAHP